DLRGQGGEAIRAFYRDAHEPFLVLFHQFLIDYSNLLKDMKEAVGTFESNSSGYVNQEFLETDVDEGFAKVEKTATELTDDANEILADVEEIVSVKRIDESEVVEDVQRGKEKAKEIVRSSLFLMNTKPGAWKRQNKPYMNCDLLFQEWNLCLKVAIYPFGIIM